MIYSICACYTRDGRVEDISMYKVVALNETEELAVK